MVSKNIIALFLTINLVLLGFTVAKPPTCPRDTEACSGGYDIGMKLSDVRYMIPCCTLLACLDASVASVCICNALKAVSTTVPINVGLGHVLNACADAPLAPGIKCV